jgi:hypothetical protein
MGSSWGHEIRGRSNGATISKTGAGGEPAGGMTAGGVAGITKVSSPIQGRLGGSISARGVIPVIIRFLRGLLGVRTGRSALYNLVVKLWTSSRYSGFSGGGEGIGGAMGTTNSHSLFVVFISLLNMRFLIVSREGMAFWILSSEEMRDLSRS